MPIRADPGQPWNKTAAWMRQIRDRDIFSTLEKYAQMGVAALSAATPVGGGETAGAWSYDIVRRSGYYSIRWKNTHKEGGAPIAILLQYGHGTGTGGYVQGRDYINPAMQPIFDQIDAEVRKVVTG